jgi:hypothetical protein
MNIREKQVYYIHENYMKSLVLPHRSANLNTVMISSATKTHIL